ncbi:hypothetical protein BIY21_13285 [Vibrio ponticus]|uniref:Peptidase S8/S53 domain-containing protein n=1 Tax=Vibrio ponticus TaxID=265668 RepID=A0ABX3FES0_9VIBR|nr:S8 family serine peptidase [Vibrio ponticus]OLQ91322.1 hypothetical protein BIY21_13285 [Vibrio ponticus]
MIFRGTQTLPLVAAMLFSFAPLSQANDAPWLVRIPANDLLTHNQLSQLESRVIYRFLNGDVLVESPSPSELVNRTGARVSYLERAPAISTGDIATTSSVSVNDHLLEDGIAALSAIERQCDQVKIAVIDSGVDEQHTGWGNTYFEQAKSVIDHNPSVDDRYGHGTHVTGIISSEFSSDLGQVEGACVSASVIPIRFLGDYGNGTISDSIEAIQWAIDAGADIINHSWVTSSESIALRDVLFDANQRGIVQIAAAGNSGSNNENARVYPANYSVQLDGMLAVANWDSSSNRLNPSSNYSYTLVDIAASGTDILSLYPDEQTQVLSGTSMAAPIVSSVAAMLWQQDSHLSATQINAKLLNSVKPERSLIGKVNAQGRLDAIGAITLGSIPTSIVSVDTSVTQITLSGILLDQVTNWSFRPALADESEWALTTTLATAERVEFEYSELPYGYFQGYGSNGELLVSYPYQSELIAPSEVKLSSHDQQLLLDWRGSIWAHSYEIQEFKNGRFTTIATVVAPNNQLSIELDENQSVRYRVRANYQYQFDEQSPIDVFSSYSGEVESGNLFAPTMVRAFADIPLNTTAEMLLDLDSSANYQLVDDPDGKVISLSGSQIQLDTSEVGEWSFTLINNAYLSTLTYRVVETQDWVLRSTQGANIKVSTDQADVVSVSEMGEQKIAITATPRQSPYLISLTIEGSYYMFDNIDVEIAAASSTTWQVVSRSGKQLNLQVEAQDKETFVIQPKISAPIAQASSDSRCFVASKIYANQPSKINKLRKFRDEVLSKLPGGDWLIDLYYDYSPRLVQLSEKHPQLTSAVRKLLDQLIKIL